MVEVSGPTVSDNAVPCVGAVRFNVTPPITLFTVLLVLLTGTPSTVSTAFKPGI